MSSADTNRTWWWRWLCGGASDRARYLDMHGRFANAHLFGIAMGGTTVLAAFTYGWWLVALMAVASATMAGGMAVSSRWSRPEPVGAVTFLLLQVNIAVSVLLSGGVESPLLSLMVVPVFTQAVCFRPQVTLAWVSTSGLLAVGAVVAADVLAPVPASPKLLSVVSHLALLFCLALAARDLASSDVSSRDEAVLDPLTGLFNRKALEKHFADARARARRVDGEIGMVMCDLDRFKDVNDTYGHVRGDLVLTELATQLRESVRESDLIYRLGGEEFLVLLPDHGTAAAAAVAERVRAHISAHPLADLPIRISAGVTSARGRAIDFTRMAREADGALYDAKRGGRNRVHTALGAPSLRT